MNPGSWATVWPYLATLGLLVALGWFSWRRRSVPGAFPLAVACLFAAVWQVGTIAELLAVAASAKIAWVKFQAVCQLPGVTATTCFALEYVYPGRWLTRRNVILLSLPPLLLLALVLTNGLHHWFWRGFLVDGYVQPLRGGANWTFVGYGMGLILIDLAAFAWLFIRSPRHRWPVVLMALGQILGRALYAVDIATGETGVQPDPLNLSLALVFGTYAIAMFGFRIFDPLPAARRIAIEQMQEGMVVFDTGWQALSLNPAAEHILATPAALAQGKTWSELLPTCPDPGRCLEPGSDPIEICLPERHGDDVEAGSEGRRYALALSVLHDHRELLAGYLLLLRDVTERRRAEAQRLEQQWAQATLQERELLAQELHDGLAQDLGFLNVQAQAANLFLRSGRAEAAQDSLDRLTEIALETQGDTRELIGDLLTVSMPSEGLCGAVRQTVARFKDQTSLSVSLMLAEDVDALCRSSVLPPAAGVQLLRILQEALANVRKHAGCPSQIGVQLMAEDGHLRMTVTDNGPGFDPAVASAGGQHFGLQVMAQRAERIGGQLAVHSKHDHGTQVEVCVPLDWTIPAVREEGAEHA
jgi:signal transduction histidine kinase